MTSPGYLKYGYPQIVNFWLGFSITIMDTTIGMPTTGLSITTFNICRFSFSHLVLQTHRCQCDKWICSANDV